jgi:hypothetical protein
MNSEHIPNGQVSEAVIREMLDGLEGVTPGPWLPSQDTPPHVFTEARDEDGDSTLVATAPQGAGYVTYAARRDVAHIARCDPDTMRQVLTLALEGLAARSGVKVDEAAKRVCLSTGLDWDYLPETAENDGTEDREWFRMLARAALIAAWEVSP